MLLLFLVLITQNIYGQSRKASSWLLTGLEIPSYTGDLNSYAQFNNGFTLGFRLNHRENLNGQIMLMAGVIKGDNRRLDLSPGQEAPNSFFNTSLIEVSYQLHYYIYQSEHFAFYISQGAGILRFNPRDEFGNSLADNALSRAENENYRNITLVLPSKIGGQYLFPNQFGINLEAGWHNPLSDYLDNISELGGGGSDNILFFRIGLMAPLGFKED